MAKPKKDDSAATENAATDFSADNSMPGTPGIDKAERDVPTYVYVGPSLPGGILKMYTILQGTMSEISEYYKEISINYPEIDFSVVSRCIVPVEKLAVTRQNIEKKGNLAHKYYCDIADWIEEIRKKEAEKYKNNKEGADE